jgi:hypothetical protein
VKRAARFNWRLWLSLVGPVGFTSITARVWLQFLTEGTEGWGVLTLALSTLLTVVFWIGWGVIWRQEHAAPADRG